jgi:phytoene dehydrogenase-like protein
MPDKYDVIIIGGGHNGLVNAAYLAKSGLKVKVLERQSVVGGAAITEELLPGYQFTTFSYALSLMRPDIVHDLELTKHGLMVLPFSTTFAPMENGDHLFLDADPGQNYHEIARHSKRDAEAMADYSYWMERICQAVKPLLDQIPPNLFSDEPDEVARLLAFGQHMKGLDPKVLHYLVRLVMGSASDFLDEWFESDIVKGLLASSGIIGSKMGPRSQGSGLVLLYHSFGEVDGVFGEWGFHKGGNGGFTQAVARSAQAFGADIQTGAAVQQVLLKNGRAIGAVLENGDEFYADTVVSSLDPRRTFLQMVPERELPVDFAQHIKNYKFDGTSAKVNFALDGLPQYPGLEGRRDIFNGFVNVAPSIDYLERAFDDAKYGQFSRRPYLDVCIQSVVDPDMSPPGKHVMSCFVQYAPYHLKESDWDTQKEPFGDVVQDTFDSFFPGFSQLVSHREVVTPLDIERTVGLTEGNIFQGEFLGPQMFFFRPAPGWNQYRTPIDGYYACGSGTHPGGCVMGAPGKLAAQQILNDRAKAG